MLLVLSRVIVLFALRAIERANCVWLGSGGGGVGACRRRSLRVAGGSPVIGLS